MKYSEFRKHIRSGDLLAWSHRGWSSWYDIKIQAIRVFDRTEYTHVGMALVLGGRVWVVESVTPLPRLVPLSNLLSCYHVDIPGFHFGQPDIEHALSYVGNDEYSYSQIEAIKAFFGENDPENQKLECAEFVKMIWNRAGLVVPGRDVPSDLVRETLGLGGKLTLLEA